MGLPFEFKVEGSGLAGAERGLGPIQNEIVRFRVELRGLRGLRISGCRV